MNTKWIAVVNRTEARIFSAKDFQLITRLRNPLGREKNRALSHGKPGVAHGKFMHSSSFYNLTGEKNPHEDAACAFAKKVSNYLAKNLGLGRFDKVLVAAEPKMLGRLKSEMNKNLSSRTEWRAKDFGKLEAHELRKALRTGPLAFG